MSLKEIPVSEIRENPVALREVDTKSEEYLSLVDSVRANGVLMPILVRESVDQVTGATFYGLIDGLHRYSAAKDAGRETIPVNCISADDAKTLKLQIISNLFKIDTKPYEYSKQLERILAGDPFLSQLQLADQLNRSVTWLQERLGLLKLNKELSPLVDGGQINLSNAYQLAKLPLDEQLNFKDMAQSMPPSEFIPTVNARKKELDTARRQGRDAAPAEYVPVPHLQRVTTLTEELAKPVIGPLLIQKNNLQTAEQGFQAGLQWALHLDADSIEAAKKKDADRKKAAKEKSEGAKKERAEKAVEAAKKRLAEVTLEEEAKAKAKAEAAAAATAVAQ